MKKIIVILVVLTGFGKFETDDKKELSDLWKV